MNDHPLKGVSGLEGGLRNPRRWAGAGLVIVAAAVAVAPMLVRGNSCGHDFDFHLVSWIDCLHAWRHGIAFPHWAPSANFGAGEPRFVFYPPLTWMLGAALGSVLPWQLVPIALTFVLLAATGLATRSLARQSLTDAPATLAGCTAIFSGYALFCAYERSAFAEMAGGLWFPLLLLFALREREPGAPVLKRAFDGSAVPLALVLAGAWLSNAPVGVMASYLLAAVALIAALHQRSWAPVIRSAASAALGLGLAAFYLLPAAIEWRWVDIRQAIDDPGERIESSWLFGHNALARLALHDVELQRVSLIAVSMLAVAGAGLLVAWRRGRLTGNRRWWLPLAIIPPAILMLQFPFSQPVWDLLPKLRFLQFPWRWLVALEAPMAIFFATAIWPKPSAHHWQRRTVSGVCGVFFLAASLFAGVSFFQPCDDEDCVPGMLSAYRAGTGFDGEEEYAPPGAENSLVATGLPAACLVTNPAIVLGRMSADVILTWDATQGTCEATFPLTAYPGKARPEHLRIAAIAPHGGYLVLRLRDYPAWRIEVNGREVHDFTRRVDGLVAVPVSQGPIDLTADWTTTPDVRAGRAISWIALSLLTALTLVERKLRPTGLS